MNPHWNNTVFLIHKRWLAGAAPKYTPHSTKFQQQLFEHATTDHRQLYDLLRTLLPTEEELTIHLDKLGKWFLRQDVWSEHKHRRMVTRSLNRYMNDSKSNKSLQLLAIVASYEYTNAWKVPTR